MFSIRKRLLDLMSVRSDDPELLRAQYHAFSRQLPTMYFLLITSTWAVAFTHMGMAPHWLTIAVPVLFTLGACTRVLFWLKSKDHVPTPEAALATLKRTNRLSVIIALSFTSWALALYTYGDAYTQSHVAFYMAITVIACIFSLMYLRSAALIVTVIVNGSFVAFFVATGLPTFIAIAINVVLVCVGMLAIVTINYRNFERMVEAQRRTEALSNENLRLANIDSLTDLPNRRAFFAHLQQAYARAKADNSRLAVGIIDLDGFKPVNDLYGHSVGDKLLMQVSMRLSHQSHVDNFFIARLGGDEFAIVVSDAPQDDELAVLGSNLCAVLCKPFVLPEASVQISGSVGMAVYPDMAGTTEELFDRADYALYHSKRTKRGECTLFASVHIEKIQTDARIEQVLRQADLEKELSVVFQPIVNIQNGQAVAFEALARWTNPELGAVSPAQFIPVAERVGIIGQLTRPLLRKALAVGALWPEDIRLSFNLSAHDLNTSEGVLAVVAIIETSGFDARRLDLEITETAFIHDFDQVQKSIGMLRLLGCGVSLDDFGTGYSSLSYLHALPLTKIKIDRSFVTKLQGNATSYKIVKSLLSLSRDMGLDCVVEGVETSEELASIKKLGGVLVQGYLYSPPIPSEQVEVFLQSTAFEATKTA